MDVHNSKALRMKGMPITSRILLVKFIYGLLATDDVIADNWCHKAGGSGKEKRMKTDEFRKLNMCALCGQSARGEGRWARNWHLIA